MATIRRNRALSIARTTDSDPRVSSIALANDDELQVTLQPNSKYDLTMMLQWTNAGAGKFQYGFLGPEGSTASNPDLGQDVDISASSVMNDDGQDDGQLRESFFIRTGAKGGTLTLQWSQDVSDAGATILRSGSYLSLLKVD